MRASPFPKLIPETARKVVGEPNELLPPPPAFLMTHLWHWVRRLEWLVIPLIACLSVALHIRFVTHAGGLWRDEANSAQLATLPSLGDVWNFMDYDSFPIFFFAVLRGWLAIFGSANDTALRILGGIIGLGILAALWINARAFGARCPLLSLALIGLNPMFIRYGDSTRAYGLGILLMLLTLWSFWRLVDSPTSSSPKRVWRATALALFAVQCLYYNAVLLLAIAAGAVAVAFRARAWRTVMIVLGIGLLAATSLLFYVPMMQRMHSWTFLVSYPIDFLWLWNRACEVIGSPDPLLIWVWMGLLISGIGVVAGYAIVWLGRWPTRRQAGRDDPEFPFHHGPAVFVPPVLPDAVLFATIALIVGVPAYAVFLRVLRYYTEPWYYITLTAFVAWALDIIFGLWPATEKLLMPLLLRGFRLAVAVALLCLAGLPAWETMRTRQTNVDLLAAQLRCLAKRDDVILFSHWEPAVAFYRYYLGPAEVVTLPPIADHRFHRYDLVLRNMLTADPINPSLRKITATLQGGHTVWLAGGLKLVAPGGQPRTLPPGFDGPQGRVADDFYAAWSEQVSFLLQAHARSVTRTSVPVPRGQLVSRLEDLPLTAIRGWRPAESLSSR